MAWPTSSPLREPPLAEPAVSPAIAGLLLGLSAGILGWVGFRLVDAAHAGWSACWAVDGVYLIALARCCASPPGRRLRAGAAGAAVCTVGFLVGGLLAGRSAAQLLPIAVGNLAAAGVAVWVYRRGPDARSWVPRDAPEAVWLMLAIAPAAGVGALLGAYPGTFPDTGFGPAPPGAGTAWAAVRQFSTLAVTVNCILPLLYRPGRQLLHGPSRMHLPGYLIGVATCLVLPHLLPQQPLSWLYVVLAAWTGLLFPIRGTALVALAIVGVFVGTSYQLDLPGDTGAATIGPQLLTDFTPAFIAHVALLLAVFRENLLALRAEVAERAGTERDRREILDGIVQTLTHGLLLTHPDGRVSLTNRATTQLVGPVPDRVTTEWIRQVELQAADVHRIVDGADQPSGEGPRRVSVTSQDVDMAGERLNLLLLKDVTAAHDRQEQLEAFAGTVAHDLKTPLAALTGWMDAAADEFAGGDPSGGLTLLHRAQSAVFRMQRLIDDYLASAISRAGTMTITDVPLTRVVTEIVTVYAARGSAPGTEPAFTIDCPHVVRADEALTRQLLGHLVAQAVRYARPGRPAHVAISSVAADPGWVQVSIADRGRGRAPGAEDRLVAALGRDPSDAVIGRDAVGDEERDGLDLALCQAIVTRHGGRISATTNGWGGATVRFTLPAGAAA